MSEQDFIKFDGWCKGPCPDGVVGVHMHGDAEWTLYRDALTPEQLQWLRRKAQLEGMTLTAVATDWGVPR